jgi:hypothetical protein
MIIKVRDKKNEEYLSKQKEIELQMKKERENAIFQHRISSELRRERERLQQKAFVAEQKHKISKIHEQKKNSAFELLNEAQAKIKSGDFDGAINDYKEVEKIFEEINWNDEIPLIRNSIHNIESKKRENQTAQQKYLNEKLIRDNQDLEFQNQITNQIKQERKKLKEQQLAIRKREEELKIREKRRDEAFKMMDEANRLIEEGKFDNAKNLFIEVGNIFAEIQWLDEIELIQNSVLEIDKMKREAQERKNKELLERLEKARQEREFQSQIAFQSRSELEKVKQKELKIKEREKELAIREKEKGEAFKLLDNAESMITNNDYNGAIEIYQEVISKFARIGWLDEVPLIRQAIQAAEEKKKELEMQKQRLIL